MKGTRGSKAVHALLFGALFSSLVVACDEPAPPTSDTDPAHEDPHAGSDGTDSTHATRDPNTQPCNIDNWERLSLDLRQCDLVGATLAGANLRRANLADANLQEAKLEGADLFKANLTRANLARANLKRVNLTSADLTAADLSGADLTGARLNGANTSNITTTGAITDATTVCMSGAAGPCW